MASQISVADDSHAASVDAPEAGGPPAGPGPMAVPSSGGSRRNRGGDKEKETFPCLFPGCGQNYSRMEYLKRHQRKHQDDRPFQCKDCSKAFARSDVLLRHRRRCHPTPPPVGRSTSPPAPNRIYSGMPVSSSRMDAREASPPRQRSRKHRRHSDHDEEQERQRARLDPSLRDEVQEEEEGRYDDGNYENGSYGQYYGASGDEHPNYSGDFMPAFSQSQPYHSGPDHLEDAAALLSMAYPGGVPGGEKQPEEQRDMPDWASNPTINLIMETAVANQELEENGIDAATTSGEKETTPAQEAAVDSALATETAVASLSAEEADIDPSLQNATASEGFASAMNWLSTMDSQGA